MLFLLAPGASVVEPHVALYLFAPLGAAALLLPRPPGAPPPLRVDPPVAALLMLLLLWGAISLLWTTAPSDGIARWFAAVGLALLLLVSLEAARTALPSERRMVRRAVVAGFVISLLLLAEERVLGAPLYRWTVGWEVSPQDAWTKMSRALSLVGLLAWAIVAIPAGPIWCRWAAPFTAFIFTILLGQFAGTLALLLAMAVWALHMLGGRRVWSRLWPPLLLLLLIGGPFALWGLGQLGLETAEWLPNTARYRIQIWAVASERLFEAPVLGWGFEASENLPDRGAVSIAGSDHVVTGHPHNVLLQLWLELGIPGLIYGGGLLALLFYRVRRASAAALLINALALGLLSFGLWRSHSLAILAMAILAYALTSSPSSDDASESESAASTA